MRQAFGYQKDKEKRGYVKTCEEEENKLTAYSSMQIGLFLLVFS